MTKEQNNRPEFDFDAIFRPEDYCLFWGEYVSEERTEQQLRFLGREFRLEETRSILDVACGFGRHSLGLAASGHRVTGVDNNAGFLEMASKAAVERGVPVDFRQIDMREIDFSEEFDRAVMLFTSLGFFSDEDNFKVLENVARALKSGGLFCMDTINRDSVALRFRPFHLVERGDDFAVHKINFDPVNGWVIDKRFMVRGGVRTETPFFVRIYSATEIRGLLREAGFAKYRFFGDWDGRPLEMQSERMIVIAEK
jgi:SAM-dependent methyltransferase